MTEKEFSKPLPLTRFQITDDFWKKEMELIRTEVIPYQWDALNDRVEGAAPSFCMRNFKIAGKMNRERKEQGQTYEEPVYTFRGFEALPEDMNHLEDKFYGFVFQDSDFAKWIEAVGYSLSQHPDPNLEQIADEAIDIVCAAQQEDGYLDTYYIINGKDRIFTDLRDHHELYCFGHLAEGAIAYYQATGKDRLLKAAERYADFIRSVFGPEEGKCKGYPGHEIAEMALVRLYEATGEQKYLDLSRFFIEERGKRPYYFDREHPPKKQSGQKEEELRYQYNQAHLPVRQQEEAVGHAVRGVYLYSGMADVARVTGDDTLYEACETLWNSITEQKMYITGGIGGTHIGESFSFPYDLPNDTAYAETCASIGLIFFARRMLEIKADARYANVMERALYNCVLSGMSLDGKSFFYVNPLEVLPEACHKDERKFHVKPVRQKWFGCACCPPNLARLISSVGTYAYTENEDTLWIHLYIGAKIQKTVGEDTVCVRIQSGFPYDGSVSVTVDGNARTPFTIALRLPDWCGDYTITGGEDAVRTVKNGYLYLTKQWNDGEQLQLNFPMQIQWIEANQKVREDAGKAALMRGPIVYCLEEADNGKDLHLLRMSDDLQGEVDWKTIGGVPAAVIRTKGRRRKITGTDTGLYTLYKKVQYENTELTWIPYYTWANRGEGEMQVWIRE